MFFIKEYISWCEDIFHTAAGGHILKDTLVSVVQRHNYFPDIMIPTHTQDEEEFEIFPQIFLTHQVRLLTANQIWVASWGFNFLYIFLWSLGCLVYELGTHVYPGRDRLAERWGNLWESVKKWLHFYTLLCCTYTCHSCSSFLDEPDRFFFCLTHFPVLSFHLSPALVPFYRAASGTFTPGTNPGIPTQVICCRTPFIQKLFREDAIFQTVCGRVLTNFSGVAVPSALPLTL